LIDVDDNNSIPALRNASLVPQRYWDIGSIRTPNSTLLFDYGKRRVYKALDDDTMQQFVVEMQMSRLASLVAPDGVVPFTEAYALDARRRREFDKAHANLSSRARAVVVTPFGERIDAWDIRISDICRLLGTLAKLHAAGIVHNDIKHDNCVVYNNRLCLIDFGQSQLVMTSDARGVSWGCTFGTEGFQPPDMLDQTLRNNARHYHPSPAGDVYAIGRMLQSCARDYSGPVRRAVLAFADELCAERASLRPTAAAAQARLHDLIDVCVSRFVVQLTSMFVDNAFLCLYVRSN
jgi:hypothetical protein